MTSSFLSNAKFRGSSLSLLALFCMAALISGLIIVNHFSHRSLQTANISRFQQNLEDRCRSVSYFFSERENDLQALASSSAITGFFANRSMGMSMAYGLRASLNNVDRLFAQRGKTSRLGGADIYSGLLLLDADGQTLSRWPGGVGEPLQEPTEDLPQPWAGVMMASHADGKLSFTCPVFQNEKVQGFVRGWIHCQILAEYLLRDIPGILIMADNHAVVFQSQGEPRLAPDRLKALIDGKTPPVSALPSQLTAAAPHGNATPYAVFFAPVPGYDLLLTILDNSSALGQQRSQLFFTASLFILSLAAFGAAALILRAGSRKLVLETSLNEAYKREKAIAEKKEELELVLEGARLGTWSWNLANNEITCNARYWTMLGLGPKDAGPDIAQWQQLLHPDDAASVVAALNAHLAGDAPFYTAEYRMRHRNGGWIWIHDTGKIVQRDQAGDPLRAFGIHLDVSERKESIRLLAKAKEESDAIIRDFLDTLIIVNTSLIVVRVNQATCGLLGYSEEELLGRKVFEFFHDARSHIQAAFAFYAEGESGQTERPKELRNIEMCYRHKNGDRFPMSFNISLLTNELGEITGVVAGAKDVSHLRRALDQIAQQKEYIETLFDIVPEGLLVLSPTQEIVKSNRAYDRLLDVWSNRLHISVEACSSRLVEHILAAQNEQNAFTVQLKQDAVVGYFRCNSISIPMLKEHASVVSIGDITNERTAHEERKLLATVIEQTGDSVYITGIDQIIQYANPAAIKNSGYTEAELQGTAPLIFRSDLMDPDVLAEMLATLAEGRIWHGRFRCRRKDGSIIEEDATISPVRNEEGELTHHVGIKRDITEMTNLQRQLMQSQKLEAIGQLAAGIAHEINTPMQYVQNNVIFFEQVFSDLQTLMIALKAVEPDDLPGAVAAALELADLEFMLEELPASITETLDGIGRVVKIVSAMKEFSHPGNYEKSPANLNHALENTLTVCRNEWKYVAELVTDLPGDLPLVPCFPDQLNQAVLNLIINASHAIQERLKTEPNPPGRISVSTRRNGEWVEIRVSDNGCGIPDEIQQRVFEPFFTTKEVGKGTGQGLTIVHDIVVKKHGGQIDVTSAPGAGATFLLRLPLMESAEQPHPEALAPDQTNLRRI
jgi:PAS domain S-box-containing protein